MGIKNIILVIALVNLGGVISGMELVSQAPQFMQQKPARIDHNYALLKIEPDGKAEIFYYLMGGKSPEEVSLSLTAEQHEKVKKLEGNQLPLFIKAEGKSFAIQRIIDEYPPQEAFFKNALQVEYNSEKGMLQQDLMRQWANLSSQNSMVQSSQNSMVQPDGKKALGVVILGVGTAAVLATLYYYGFFDKITQFFKRSSPSS